MTAEANDFSLSVNTSEDSSSQKNSSSTVPYIGINCILLSPEGITVIFYFLQDIEQYKHYMVKLVLPLIQAMHHCTFITTGPLNIIRPVNANWVRSQTRSPNLSPSLLTKWPVKNLKSKTLAYQPIKNNNRKKPSLMQAVVGRPICQIA